MTSEVFAAGMLAGRVALITGGGTNLGKAAAIELAAAALASSSPAGDDVLLAATEDIGEGASWVAGDIRERPEAAAIVRAALERHSRLDFLLNNTGG
ncbi:MAG TPA: SDR family NAD(P)-dependent oxidoreductase [Solirubrobacteraceae bacterium]|nr:SDR family NAD(P)-dependent oxidoreductase [Solirubrobacteraceae bacterium]